MTTILEPITEEEFLGYLSAMMENLPWGEPMTALTSGVPVG